MAHYFKYDRGVHKHMIYGMKIQNEKNEIVGYKILASRVDTTPGANSLVEDISENYYPLKNKVFSSEKIARDFAIEFFNKLDCSNE